ncbi:MAG: hypothetical protein L3K14_04295 [Thermoplasmata archaeon]|nr:hypothetical protein [Thermoplasmata archaeon]
MPESSRRIFATQNIRFVKIAKVPLSYAYAWCTDFRSDDGKFSGSTARYRVLKAAPDRAVRIRTAKSAGKTPVIAIELVRLMPPDRWHVDQVDETDLAAVDYELTKLGPNKTRIELRITERWMTPRFPSRSDYLRTTSDYWDKLVGALETRHAQGRPPRG